jgi:type II restriction enzyme
MNLALEFSALYKSSSQKARVATEPWVCKNLYCPKCAGILAAFAANTKSKDVWSVDCGEEFQVKSKKGKIGSTLLGAEYNTTLQSFRTEQHPSLILLGYAQATWSVVDVQLIHRAFLTESCLVARPKLGPGARRAGWQGCIYNLAAVPQSGRIDVVKQGQILSKERVLSKWRAADDILKVAQKQRSWVADVLRVVEALPSEFSLEQVYTSIPYLAKQHPNNNHIAPKIRQQLQVLRDMGKLEFLGRGRYRRVSV